MRFIAALLAGVLATTQAHALTYVGQFKGSVTEQLDTSFDDPVLQVGDELRVFFEFDDDSIFPPSGWTEPLAHLTSLIVSGPEILVWSKGDDILDGPWVDFKNGKVTGFYTDLIKADVGWSPGLISMGTDSQIYDASGIYGNTRKTPGFTIMWDFANSSVLPQSAAAPVPEPAEWMLMLVGFLGIGTIMRRQGKLRRNSTANVIKV